MARRHYSSIAARTTLASGVDDTTTTFVVVAVSNWPASYPYTLIVDQDTVNEEIVEVTGRSGTTLTVTRGVDGSSAVAHSSGAAVNHGVSARDFDEPNEFINGTGVVTSDMIDSIEQSKITDLTSDLASKLPYSYGTATPSTSDDGFLWYDSNSTPPDVKFWDGAAFQALTSGKILQVVRATDTTQRSTTSTSFVDVTGMSVTITPTKSTSAVIVIASFLALAQTSPSAVIFASYRITDSSNNAISGAEKIDLALYSGTEIDSGLVLIGYATPATTSATTYKLRFQAGASDTALVANNTNTGQMYAIEVGA